MRRVSPPHLLKVFHTQETGDKFEKSFKTAMVKKKQSKFSVVKAVKANARERVGQPKPARAIEDAASKQRRKQKHKPTLGGLLETE